jgi:quercetin dioxygenase-like cupin family protein
MPLIRSEDTRQIQRFPGVVRREMVNEALGARGLTVGELVLDPGSGMPPHVHTNEEAMVITEGELEASLGDETCLVQKGDAVLAPVGIPHGFRNLSSAPARVVFIHPVLEIVTRAP